MEVVELLKELIKRQSITPNECGIYEIIKAELADFKAIEVEKNGVKNLFLYKDFAGGNSAESRLDSAKSQNLVKKELCEAPENSPASWCKKSGEASSSASADFLLEAEKRGSPPKSEKAAAFWEHNKKELGGAGRGVQPFLQKESSENNSNEIAESTRDSSPTAQNDNFKKNTESSLDSANKDKFAKPHLCFAGHIDVVPAGFGWSVPPFDALIKNGVLYGRGAQDMKGGVAAFVSALQKVKNFNGTLSVLLTSDEEGDGIFGTKIMLEYLKERGLLPHFAIVAEPTCEKKLGDSIKIGRRGSVNGVLKIYGTQGHAAYPHKCTNPLDLIAPILAQISSKDLDSGDKYFAPSKIVITDIRGGIEATNVTPAELKLMFNVRNNPLTDKNAIKSYVESLLKSAGIKKYDLSLNQGSFPFITDSNALLNSLTNVIKSRTHTTPRPNTEGGTSDARYFSAFGVEVVEFGLVNDRIHAVDECVNLRDLEALRDIFVDFIADFDSAIRVRNNPKKSPQDEF